MSATSAPIKRVLWVALLGNLVVALAKTIYGFITGTLSMIADGLHSFVDATGSIVALISVSIAYKPSDSDHHYGHHKFETIAALGIGAFIGLTSWEVLRGAIHRFSGDYHPSYYPTGIYIVIATMCVNLGLSFYEHRKGKKHNSQILIADSFHTASDFLTSLAVLISLIGIRQGVFIIDPIVSVVIAAYLAWIAFKVVKDNILDLSDAAFIDTDQIKRICKSAPGVISCHQVRTRGRQGMAFVDLHIQVSPDMDTTTSHSVVHDVEERIKREVPGIRDILIHTEPYPTDE